MEICSAEHPVCAHQQCVCGFLLAAAALPEPGVGPLWLLLGALAASHALWWALRSAFAKGGGGLRETARQACAGPSTQTLVTAAVGYAAASSATAACGHVPEVRGPLALLYAAAASSATEERPEDPKEPQWWAHHLLNATLLLAEVFVFFFVTRREQWRKHRPLSRDMWLAYLRELGFRSEA